MGLPRTGIARTGSSNGRFWVGRMKYWVSGVPTVWVNGMAALT